MTDVITYPCHCLGKFLLIKGPGYHITLPCLASIKLISWCMTGVYTSIERLTIELQLIFLPLAGYFKVRTECMEELICGQHYNAFHCILTLLSIHIEKQLANDRGTKSSLVWNIGINSKHVIHRLNISVATAITKQIADICIHIHYIPIRYQLGQFHFGELININRAIQSICELHTYSFLVG